MEENKTQVILDMAQQAEEELVRAVDVESAKLKAPHVRVGENPLTSRGFSFMRLGDAIREKDWSWAKVEREVHSELEKMGYAPQFGGTLVPLDLDYLMRENPKLRSMELRKLMQAEYQPSFGLLRAMGEDSDAAGGYLVNPEYSPELIEMLRAKSVVEQAGARVLTLPKSGQLDIAKQTGGATGYWVGENLDIGESELTLGNLQLRAKYLAGLIVASNRSLRHSTPSLEGLIREDLALTLALTQDLAFINGAGTATTPKGIINYSGVQILDKTNTKLAPDDLFDAFEMIEAVNGIPGAWIGNTKIKNQIIKLRTGALSSEGQPDYSVGNFIFDFNTNSVLGKPFLVSTQIPVASDMTFAILGMFSEAIIAREAVFEVASDTSVGFTKDQTYFRAILGCDFSLRWEDVFVYIKDIAV